MNPDTTIAELVRDQRGMVTRSQALAAGLSSHQLEDRVDDGVLEIVHPSVYAHRAVPRSRSGRLMAAVLLGGGDAVASHRSAAELQRLRDVPRFRPEITITMTDLPRPSGVLVHRTTYLDPLDVTVIDQIRCTAVPRTLLDLGAVLPYAMVEVAVHDAIVRDLVTHAQLFSVLERVGKRGRRGTAALRAVMRGELPDEKLESELEWRLYQLLPPGFELQYPLICEDGRHVRLDAALPDRKIAIEANGRRWHAIKRDMERDLARRRSIQASGWTHYEYGWSDVTERTIATRAELLRIFVGSTA